MAPTVLIVDDDQAFRETLAEVLEAAGYAVLRASDGPMALRIIEHFQRTLDLVVLDLSLPRMSGFEIIGELTRHPLPVKIVATTAVFKDLYLEIAAHLGAHATLRKASFSDETTTRNWLDLIAGLTGGPDNRTVAQAH